MGHANAHSLQSSSMQRGRLEGIGEPLAHDRARAPHRCAGAFRSTTPDCFIGGSPSAATGGWQAAWPTGLTLLANLDCFLLSWLSMELREALPRAAEKLRGPPPTRESAPYVSSARAAGQEARDFMQALLSPMGLKGAAAVCWQEAVGSILGGRFTGQLAGEHLFAD